MTTPLQQVKARLAEMGASPKKALGQNFLIQTSVIEKIIQRAHGFSSVVEIGPGLGALTEPMLKSGVQPVLLELDSEFANYWRGRGLQVFEGDALKLNWQDLQLPRKSLLLSNLPYQISSSIVIERCLGPENIHTMVLMFQKEVAQRLMAQSGTSEYGFLSVMAQLHFSMEKVVDAGPSAFYPAPKVSSRVLAFVRREDVSLGHGFLRFAKACFRQRRKFLLKNLAGVVDNPGEALAALNWSLKVRAEELTPLQFVELYKLVELNRTAAREKAIRSVKPPST